MHKILQEKLSDIRQRKVNVLTAVKNSVLYAVLTITFSQQFHNLDQPKT
jgi:hypothetical protein